MKTWEDAIKKEIIFDLIDLFNGYKKDIENVKKAPISVSDFSVINEIFLGDIRKILNENKLKLSDFRISIRNEINSMDFERVKKLILYQSVVAKIPENLEYINSNFYIKIDFSNYKDINDYNRIYNPLKSIPKVIEREQFEFMEWNIEAIVEMLDNLDKMINWNIGIIEFQSKDDKFFELDLKNEEHIKNLIKELKDLLKNQSDKNSEKFKKLSLEINNLKDQLKSLKEGISLKEIINIKKEIKRDLINILPYGNKLLSAFNIIKSSKSAIKLIEANIEL